MYYVYESLHKDRSIEKCVSERLKTNFKCVCQPVRKKTLIWSFKIEFKEELNSLLPLKVGVMKDSVPI